jgi:hypothetical protein
MLSVVKTLKYSTWGLLNTFSQKFKYFGKFFQLSIVDIVIQKKVFKKKIQPTLYGNLHFTYIQLIMYYT